MTPTDIFKLAKEANAFLNYFRVNHRTSGLSNTINCRKCSQKHHTWLHREETKSRQESKSNENKGSKIDETRTIHACNDRTTKSRVLLATLLLDNDSYYSVPITIHALFDPGAEACSILDQYANQFKLHTNT